MKHKDPTATNTNRFHVRTIDFVCGEFTNDDKKRLEPLVGKNWKVKNGKRLEISK